MPVADAAAAVLLLLLLLLRALLLLPPLVLQLSTVIIFALPSRKRLATFTDAPPSPFTLPSPTSYSFLSHSQKKRTKYCRSQISFESASKLPLVALYWMAVVACCRHRALSLPPFPLPPSPSSLPQLETVVYILLGQNSRLKFFN